MSPRPKFDRAGKVGRSLYTVVALSQKLNSDVRTRVARVRNLIENESDDPMLGHKVEQDLMFLLREAKLNASVVALRKALRAS
jgi:hypothetical protein